MNSAELVSRTDEMDYFGGEQQIASAFTQLSTDIFTLENGDRAAVPDVVVIFTGGSAPESSDGMAVSFIKVPVPRPLFDFTIFVWRTQLFKFIYIYHFSRISFINQ